MKTSKLLFIAVVLLLTNNSVFPMGPAWFTGGNNSTSPAINFLGTTDQQPLVIRTNNFERMRILDGPATGGFVGIGTQSPVDRLQIGFGDTRIGEINTAGSGTFPDYGRMLWFSGGPSGSAAKANTSENPVRRSIFDLLHSYRHFENNPFFRKFQG